MRIDQDPTSGWKEANAWATWEATLPPSYVYRLRVVDASGTPLGLGRVCGKDACGLLYIGMTGPRDDAERFRAARLGQGIVSDRDSDPLHGAVARARSHGLIQKMLGRDPGCRFQIGWDSTNATELPAGRNVISTSGTEHARSLERAMLRGYSSVHGELPPLNHQEGQFMRDTDYKTQLDIEASTKPIDALGESAAVEGMLSRLSPELIAQLLDRARHQE
jgi:hypothetical protein